MRTLAGRLAAACAVALAAAWWLGFDGGLLTRGSPAPAARVATHKGTPWARFLAPEGTCRHDTDGSSSEERGLFAMRCLLDWARREHGLPALPLDHALERSAALKASAIVRCGEFSHTPCNAAFSATFDAVGWRGSSGENIAWGAAAARVPRVLVDGWLHSDGHRRNLFTPSWRAQGLAFVRVDEFQGRGPATIWVHQFGVEPSVQ